MKIFLSIASYRDPLLHTTVMSAYKNADNPQNLVFGVVDQSDPNETFNLDRVPFRTQVRYHRVDPIYARGACWARALAQTLWSNEEYYLQIDSHTLFDPGWDTALTTAHRGISTLHARPVITAYPHSFEVVGGDITNLQQSKFSGMLTLVAGEGFSGEHEMYVHTKARIIDRTEPTHGYLVSGNFLFTTGDVVQNVPYDPFLFFSGEEHSYALRLWTHGYNIFHLPEIPIYTHYGRDYRTTIWSDKLEAHRPTKWWQWDMKSKARLADIVVGKDLGVYGLGRERTLDQYIELTGIDYKNRVLLPKSLDGEHIFSKNFRMPL